MVDMVAVLPFRLHFASILSRSLPVNMIAIGDEGKQQNNEGDEAGRKERRREGEKAEMAGTSRSERTEGGGGYKK